MLVLTKGLRPLVKYIVHPDCHPSWNGMLKPAFVARFKYGYKPWKAWVNFLVKNATVETYLTLAEEIHPKPAMYEHQRECVSH